jgi:DNA repair exonuclease SbcCD ATPase subunit
LHSQASNLHSKLHPIRQLCCSEWESIEHNIAEIETDKGALMAQGSSYSSLIDVFGSKGIQTFVLRNIVKALEYYSQCYLDELSEGSLQLVIEIGQNDSIIKQTKTLESHPEQGHSGSVGGQ